MGLSCTQCTTNYGKELNTAIVVGVLALSGISAYTITVGIQNDHTAYLVCGIFAAFTALTFASVGIYGNVRA